MLGFRAWTLEQEQLEQRIAIVANDLARTVDSELEHAVAILETLATSRALASGSLSIVRDRAQQALHTPDAAIFVLDRNSKLLLHTSGSEPSTPATTDVEGAKRGKTSGAALRKFRDMVAYQGGDVAVIDDTSKLPSTRMHTDVAAATGGFLTAIDADLIGRASMLLGAGRDTVDQAIDHAAGIVLRAKPGEAVGAGDPVATLHYNDGGRLQDAVALVQAAIHIAPAAGALPALVLARLEKWLLR